MRISRDCFANFVAGHSHDIRASVVRISCVANWSRSFSTCWKILCEFFLQNILQDCRATVARRSCECRELVAAKFWRIYNAKFLGHSYECRTTVARQSCENLATIWRENKTNRHSYECRATLARMSRDCRTNLNENKLHSRESRETLSRMSRDCRATVVRYIFKIRPKFANLSQKCIFNETATWKLCLYHLTLSRNSRELFAN